MASALLTGSTPATRPPAGPPGARRRLPRPPWLAPRVLRTEALAGLVVALALIPEAISFSIIAGVDPAVGLWASVTMALSIAVLGGRPAMISAATGAVALVVAPVVREHGVQYLFATVLLAGVLQVVLGLLGVARLMRFVPRSVVVGFVNALAILIAAAQLPYVVGVPWLVYPLVVLALAVLVGLPRLTTAVPAPLVAILLVTVVVLATGAHVPTVADEGRLPDALPSFGLPDVPLTWATLQAVAPYALGMALVGLMESMMTATLVDQVTRTRSSKRREAWGQGCANVVTSLFGGLGGCAMIGQTMINVRAGARTRASTFLAGGFLLVLLAALGGAVGRIPMAALFAVMVMVAVGTFDWRSIAPATLRRMPRSETAVMLVTVVATVATHDLAVGVVAGVVVAALLFARRVARLVRVEREVVADADAPGGRRAVYTVTGQLFFASSNDLAEQLTHPEDPAAVDVDLSGAHVWDASSVAVLDAAAGRAAERGGSLRLVGLHGEAGDLHRRLAGTLH